MLVVSPTGAVTSAAVALCTRVRHQPSSTSTSTGNPGATEPGWISSSCSKPPTNSFLKGKPVELGYSMMVEVQGCAPDEEGDTSCKPTAATAATYMGFWHPIMRYAQSLCSPATIYQRVVLLVIALPMPCAYPWCKHHDPPSHPHLSGHTATSSSSSSNSTARYPLTKL